MIPARREASARLADTEVSTLKFRLRFLNVSGATLKELHIDACDVAGAVALVEGLAWPPNASKMVIINASGGEVHSEGR
jgi:hypothetical protein